jgi:hypothetical protein
MLYYLIDGAWLSERQLMMLASIGPIVADEAPVVAWMDSNGFLSILN